MKKIALLCLGLLGTGVVQAQTPTEIAQAQQVFQQLSHMPLVRANFEQQKKLVSMNKTFVSKGTVLFTQQQGVLWQIQIPVKADLVVTPQKLVQKTQRTMSQINVQQSPYGSVATLFLQLMAGDQATLVKNFNLTHIEKNSNSWNIELTPKSALFKKLFKQVQAQGGQYVNQITIQEKDGNITTIRFSQQTTQPLQLTAPEYALFQLAK